MIKLLKTIVGLVILVCLFLPLSKCSMQTSPKIDSITGEVIKQSEVVQKDIVISNSVFGEGAEISLGSLILPIVFFIPFLFAVLPSFSNKKRVLKLALQSLFAIWFTYNSYLIVFTIGNPLLAGWILNFASILFLVLCLLEWLPMKHNKFKNENAASGSDASSTRPF